MGEQCLTIYLFGFSFYWMYQWICCLMLVARGMPRDPSFEWLAYWRMLVGSALLLGGIGAVRRKSGLLAVGALGSTLMFANELVYLFECVGKRVMHGGISVECQLAEWRAANVDYCGASDALLIVLCSLFLMLYLMYSITIIAASVKAVDVSQQQQCSKLRAVATLAIPVLLLVQQNPGPVADTNQNGQLPKKTPPA